MSTLLHRLLERLLLGLEHGDLFPGILHAQVHAAALVFLVEPLDDVCLGGKVGLAVLLLGLLQPLHGLAAGGIALLLGDAIGIVVLVLGALPLLVELHHRGVLAQLLLDPALEPLGIADLPADVRLAELEQALGLAQVDDRLSHPRLELAVLLERDPVVRGDLHQLAVLVELRLADVGVDVVLARQGHHVGDLVVVLRLDLPLVALQALHLGAGHAVGHLGGVVQIGVHDRVDGHGALDGVAGGHRHGEQVGAVYRADREQLPECVLGVDHPSERRLAGDLGVGQGVREDVGALDQLDLGLHERPERLGGVHAGAEDVLEVGLDPEQAARGVLRLDPGHDQVHQPAGRDPPDQEDLPPVPSDGPEGRPRQVHRARRFVRARGQLAQRRGFEQRGPRRRNSRRDGGQTRLRPVFGVHREVLKPRV